MKTLTYKRLQIILALVSLLVFLSSLYFQYIQQLQPCPLCLMQRFCALILFLTCFAGIYVHPLRARILVGFQMTIAIAGLYFAGRQLWLQALPAGQTPACMPDLEVLIRYFPWRDVLHALLWGAGDCAEITWRWLGLSMPAWAAIYFLFMLVASALLWRGLSTLK
ncbi:MULTISPECIES: disulfide bond formation protein B [unclassified Legionella]|uniref:disulfide bond formation protein B n=1 Tax=unclassified Legionella TaxID=2622702 RepID=UPI0010557E40|nr:MULTISPECIES: disulfide bond formation protein B [unclassified Legionella]MDI9819570.1 disulfide bond formation protein B [Legionella sp. PL877]